MKHFIKNLFKSIFKHKLISIISLIAFAAIAYFAYGFFNGTSSAPRYALAKIQKGTLVVSVTGTGQVSSQNQVDIKSKVSGDVVSTGATNGMDVKADDLILKLDDTDAQKAVRDAQTNLQSAQLALEKLKQPADQLSLIQAQNALAQAKENKQSAENDLAKAYEDGFNTVASAFLDLPNVMSGLNDIFYQPTLNKTQQNVDWYADQVSTINGGLKAFQYKTDFNSSYQITQTKYNANFNDYKSVDRTSPTSTVENIISETYNTSKSMADTVKKGNDYVNFVYNLMKDSNLTIPAAVLTQQTNLNSYTGTTNTYLTNLLAAKTAIENDKTAIDSAQRTIEAQQASLDKLIAGADPLDIQSQELAVQQKQNALADAQATLADYSIRAPFDGILAAVNFKKADSVSSGAVVATLIAKQQMAEITLNEVDIANVKLGQKATLTFDAVEGLSISGKVQEMDTLGTVSQGVVNYTVKILFDTQDERVKPGMSVSAAIITNVKQNALLAPNAAIKISGNNNYVEILTGNFTDQEIADPAGVVSAIPPANQGVTLGLSNDTMTEILSGLNEGDLVVTRTIASSNASSQPSQQNILQSLSGQRNTGGGGVRSLSPGVRGG